MKVIIIGASGQLGYAFYRELSQRDCQLVLVSRTDLPYAIEAAKAQHCRLDRKDSKGLHQLLKEGADWVIDLLAFHPQDVVQLLQYQNNIGHLTVVSSSSVYADTAGRTLDEAGLHGFPLFEKPIVETQARVAPGDQTYSTQKVAVENVLLEQAQVPFTILRPCAIYGRFTHHPREWWVVKRILDQRPFIPITYEGTSLFHTTAAQLVAQVGFAAYRHKTAAIVNVGDENPLTVYEIITCIADYLRYEGKMIPIPAAKAPYQWVGVSPWSVPEPFLLDTTVSKELLAADHQVLPNYKTAVLDAIGGLLQQAAGENWQVNYPQLAAYPFEQFNYALEEEYAKQYGLIS